MKTVSRLARAAICSPAAYDAVATDKRSGTWLQAALVVVGSAVAAGVGDLTWDLSDMAWQAGAALLHWFVWTAITVGIGRKFLARPVCWGGTMRALGFARVGGLFAALAWVPIAGGLLKAVAQPWMLATGVVAVRQALALAPTKAGTAKALLIALLGILPYWLALMVLY